MMEAPGVTEQKDIVQECLKQPLRKGETWFLIDTKWFKQWKKYVGFDQWDSYVTGDMDAHPGPIDNSPLISEDRELEEHLIDELDYVHLPEDAWDLLVKWYGTHSEQKPIGRKVIQQGMHVKHCKIEVYLMDIELCDFSDMNNSIIKYFSRADKIEQVTRVARQVFDVPDTVPVRMWNRYMSNTYELLSKMDHSLQDAGMYPGLCIVLEQQNPDGTWPKEAGIKRQPKKKTLEPPFAESRKESAKSKETKKDADENVAVFQAVLDCDLCERQENVDWFCRMCKATLCSTCKTTHMSRRAFKTHEIVQRSEQETLNDSSANKPDHCTFHKNMSYSLKCETCSDLVCAFCITEKHNGHTFVNLEDVLQLLKDEINKRITECSKQKKLVEETKKAIETKSRAFESVVEKTKKALEFSRTELKGRVDKHFDELLSELEQSTNGEKDKLRSQMEMMDKNRVSIENVISECDAKLGLRSVQLLTTFTSEMPKCPKTETAELELECLSYTGLLNTECVKGICGKLAKGKVE